jgi:hypothetical protein
MERDNQTLCPKKTAVTPYPKPADSDPRVSLPISIQFYWILHFNIEISYVFFIPGHPTAILYVFKLSPFSLVMTHPSETYYIIYISALNRQY